MNRRKTFRSFSADFTGIFNARIHRMEIENAGRNRGKWGNAELSARAGLGDGDMAETTMGHFFYFLFVGRA
jgi:hypothetical protein